MPFYDLRSPQDTLSAVRGWGLLFRFEWETKVEGAPVGARMYLTLLIQPSGWLLLGIEGDFGNTGTFPRKKVSKEPPCCRLTPAPVFCNAALIEITLTL